MTALRLRLEVPRLAGAQLVQLLEASPVVRAVLAEPPSDEIVGRAAHRVYTLALEDGAGIELQMPPVDGFNVGRIGIGVEHGQPYVELPGLLAAMFKRAILGALGAYAGPFRKVPPNVGRFGLVLTPGDRARLPLGPLGELAVSVHPAA